MLPRSVRSILDADRAQADDGTRKLAMTFDDGHVSNLFAAARLRETGGSADFFVNPAMVGTPHYLDWAQLREMDSWGMSIQSHGMHHLLLNDLTPAQVRSELADSRRAIEDALGRPCTLFAPPGGRVVPGLDDIAQELGYERICSSRVDLWKAPQSRSGRVARRRCAATGPCCKAPRMPNCAAGCGSRHWRWACSVPATVPWALPNACLATAPTSACARRPFPGSPSARPEPVTRNPPPQCKPL